MNSYRPVQEQYHATHGSSRYEQDSLITTISALALFIFIVAPFFLDVSHPEAVRRIVGFAYTMAHRAGSRLLSYAPSGLQRGVGDGSALKTVFGLDSGMLKSGLDALKGPKGINPPGLGNRNNSCYQNSVIQGLASIRSFRDFLANVSSNDAAPNAINTALLNMLESLNSSEQRGRQLWLPSTLKTMSTWQQQDAQEYFSKVLDQVDKEVAWETKRRMSQTTGLSGVSNAAATPASKSVITLSPQTSRSNPLEGLLAQRVGCTRCGYTDGLSMIPFNNLTVPLGGHSLYDVRDCLDEYSKLEYIEGVQCPKCTLLLAQEKYNKMLGKTMPDALAADIRNRVHILEDALKEEDFSDATLIKKCNIPKKQWVSSTKSKQAVIGRAPKSFIVHVNRSIFNEYTGAQEKNHARVHFPMFLDLNNWCLGKSSDSEVEGTTIENWSMNPQESMLADPEKGDPSRMPTEYELRAVVTHYGRHENGHYICYRKAAHIEADTSSLDEDEINEESHGITKEAWWELSDESVSLVSEDYVLGQAGVFMLFYERVDGSTSPLVSIPQPKETFTDVAGVTNVMAAEAALVPLPADDDFDDDDEEDLFKAWDNDDEAEKKPALPPRPRPTRKDSADAKARDEHDSVPADTDTATTETENEDLFQSPAAATGFAATLPAGESIRMRTSSAFATASSNEDPLQSPIRMGTAC